MNQPLIIELFGIISLNKFFDYRKNRVSQRRRLDLAGAVLRASMVITDNSSLNHLTDYVYGNLGSITKHIMRY